MRKPHLITCLALALAAAMTFACATPASSGSGEKAATYNEMDFPASRYLVAEGIGKTEPEAKNQALAELSRVFEAKVSSEANDRMKSVLTTSGATSFEQTVSNEIRVATSFEVKGVEIGKVWEDKGYYHALAVLDRAKTADQWRSDIEEIDRKIAAQVEYANGSQSPFLQYRAVKGSTKLWIDRLVIQGRMNVIGAPKVPEPYDMSAIMQWLLKAKTSVAIYMDFKSNDPSTQFEQMVGDILGQQGYVITNKPEEAAIIVGGTLNVVPVVPAPPGNKAARAIANLNVTDAVTRLEVRKISVDKRGIHLSEAEAARKAVKVVIPAIAEELLKALEE